jgi:hypothetical protein
MLTAALVFVTSATAGRRSLWSVHFWHAIEAVGFLVVSLGGIAVAEFVQARGRRNRRRDLPAASTASVPAETASDLTVGGTSAVALLPARVDTRLATASTPVSRRRATLLPLVALAGVAAAAVHVVVMPDHFEESALYGTFFATAAIAQFGYSALLLARPSRSLLAAGVLGNAAILVLWLITRTVGIPLGPAAGTTETFGGLDVLASVFELTIAIGGTALILRRQQPLRAVRPADWTPLVWALGVVTAAAITITAFVSPPS